MKISNVGARQAHQESPSAMILAFYLFKFIFKNYTLSKNLCNEKRIYIQHTYH
jgi:hypothetical protein